MSNQEGNFLCRHPNCNFQSPCPADVLNHANEQHELSDLNHIPSPTQSRSAHYYFPEIRRRAGLCRNSLFSFMMTNRIATSSVSTNQIQERSQSANQIKEHPLASAEESHGSVSPPLPLKKRKLGIQDIVASLAAKRRRESSDFDPPANNFPTKSPVKNFLTAGVPAQNFLARAAERNCNAQVPEGKLGLGTKPKLLSQLLSMSSPPNSVPSRQPALRAALSRTSPATVPTSNSSPIPVPGPVLGSRHNDITYYPNIQCVLCKEWVCARNRYIHVESHLQYKPYKCSVCGYDNRKEIFITLHLNRVHGGKGEVSYQPVPQIEERAWQLAEECLQHTRNVLMVKGVPGKLPAKQQQDLSLCAPMKPRIFNAQRCEKSQIIEETRRVSETGRELVGIRRREVQCQLCQSHFIRSPSVTEEHVRSHLSVSSYLCAHPNCMTRHWSRHFLLRHSKEVHRLRKVPTDLLLFDAKLRQEFMAKCCQAFPQFHTEQLMERLSQKYRHVVTPGIVTELS